MLVERRWKRDIDWALIGAVLALALLSLLTIASATQALSSGDFSFVQRQALFVGLGIVAAAVAVTVDYSDLLKFSRFIYVGNLCLLASVLAWGRSSLGAQRWLELGPIALQPSELSKIGVVITLAAALVRREEEEKGWMTIVSGMLHVAPLTILVLKQPDLGTSLVFLAIAFGMFFVAGVPTRHLVLSLGLGLGGAVGATVAHFRWGLPLPLKDYQLKRLLVFVNPGLDPLGAGYHIRQSMIAVGSGKLFGKGLFAGTQNQLRFLPFRHTDFIFSVVGEELGFAGSMVVLLLFAFIIWRGLRIAAAARDAFGALIAAGVVSMLAFNILVNVGMTVGVMPVTGIPLPFMSYGGSSLLTNMVGVGLMLNVHLRRHRILF
ncbi:MAG: rod shape-determining protein RodA [Firmicutes bacterium]|jgi:rod shape determining protein RodA|nr:rod shape-determining protein RodA [Bacillota bacterium]